MAQEVIVPVKVLLENLLNIAKDMRELLGTLKINSSGYKKLENVIIDIEKRIQSLQVMSARPFINSKLFSAANKEIIHIHDDLSKIRIEANKIKFSDLSLDSSLKAKLLEFDDELKTINDALKLVKDNAKDTFFSSEIGKAWKIDHPKDVGKSFAEITKIIESEVAKLEGALERAEKAQKDYKERIAAQRQLTSFITSGHELSKENLGEKLYNLIFDKNNNFKAGGRTLLQTWLQELFKLPPSVAEDLVKNAGKKVLEAFALANGNVEKTLKLEKNRIGANLKEEKTNTNNGKTYASNITQATTELNASRAVKQLLNETNLLLAKTEETLGKLYNKTKEARETYTLSLTRQAIGALQNNASSTAMVGQLQSLLQELDSLQSKILKYDLAASKLLGISNFINRYVGAYAIIRKVSTAIRDAFNNIQELDKVITSIAVVTNMSQEDLWNKVGLYTDMALQYGVATKDVYTVSQIFYQLGLLTAQVMDLTTETLKMAKIAGMEYGAAANAMTVAVRAFKIEMSEAQSVTDAYSALAAKFAVSSAEIANAMEKTASSAASVGMSLESTSAFISVMEQTTRESAQNIGSALKSIISRYGEMKASPDKLINVDGEEVAFNKVDTALSSIGISIKDAAGQFRDFDDVIMDLAAKWNTLDNNTQRYIATVMAGNRQQSRFIALVSNYDELNRAMLVASNSENASIVQVAKTMDSLETKTNLLKNAFSLLYLDLHIENGLKNIYDWLTRIITTVGKLGTFNGAIASLANIVGFGTGAKSFIKNIQERVSLRRDAAAQKESELSDKIEKTKLELDTKQAEELLGEFNLKVSTPVHKEIILDTVNSNTTSIATENNIQNTEAILTNNKDVIINSTNEILVTANTAQAEELINNLKTNIETTPIVLPVTLEANLLSDALYKSEFEKNIQDNLKSMPGIGSSLLLEPIDSESFSKMIISALDLFEDARALFSLAGTNAILDYITAILAHGGEVTSAMESIAANAAASIKIQDWFTNTFSNVDFSATAINYEQIIQLAQASLEPLKAEFLTVGSDLGLSLITGMIGTLGGTGQAAVDLALNILECIRNTLDIHSPSPLIAGMIEEGVGGGIVLGLIGAIGTVTSAAKALGESVMQGIKDGTDSDKHPIISKLLDGKNIRLASSVLRMGGTALAGYGASIQDKSTDTLERSKVVTGLGNGLSGAGTGMSLGMMTGNPLVALAGGVVGFLAGGIGAIIDGLHMSLDERLELEKKEAKEKSDAALKELAKATDISSSIDNIKKLQKAMYNSADDMKAYKDAMNTLGQSYPELISTYDSMGNAVINLQEAEETLISVRAQAATSALESAKAEMKVRSTQVEKWDEVSTKINTVFSGLSKKEIDFDNSYIYNYYQNMMLAILSGIDSEEVGSLPQKLQELYYGQRFDLTLDDLKALGNTDIKQLLMISDGYSALMYDEFIRSSPELLTDETLYNNSEYIENQLDQLLLSVASSLNLPDTITAREFFKWGGERGDTLTQSLLGTAQEILRTKMTGAKNSVAIINLGVTRSFANDKLALSLDLSKLETEKKLKISDNGIFSSLIARGLENITPKDITASEWLTNDDTKAAADTALSELVQQFMTEILNIDLNKFLAGTSDLTQYLNEDDLFAAAGITDKDSSLAQELALLFVQENLANRDRILKTIFTVDTEGKIDTSEINSIFSNLIDEGLNEELIRALGALFDGISDNLIISKYADYFSTELLAINELANNGYTKLASTRLNVLSALADALGEIDSSKEQQDLFSIITSTDFTNLDSLLNAQKAIELYRVKNNITSETDGTYLALLAIQEAEESLIFNVNTLAENLSSSISKAAKSIDSVLGSNKSGLDLSKALEGLESLNVGKSAKEAFNFNDIFRFDATLGKYVYTVQGLKAAIALVEGNLNELATRLKDMQGLYQSNLLSEIDSEDFQSSYLFKDTSGLLSNISGYRNWNTQTLTLYQGLAEDFMKASEYTEKTWENFVKYILERKESGDLAVKAAELQLTAYKANKPNQLFLNIDWAALELGTDYYDTNETLVDALADELQLEGYTILTVLEEYLKTIENVDLREATRTKINDSIIQEKTSQYQNAISELLTYSTDKYLSQATKTAASRLNINLDDLKDNAENATVVASQFLNELAKHIGQAGYTLEQYNQNASSILERTLALKSKGKALLDFASEDNIGASQLEGLANTLGLLLNLLVDVTSGKAVGIFDKYLNFNANTGAYELQGSFEEFIDVLNAKFGNIIDKTSETYTEALKSYNEGVIERNNKIKKHVKDEVNAIISAQNGDLIDISWLEREFGAERLNEIFNKYGAILHEGILRLDEDKANIPAMVSELIRELRNASENSVQLTSKELAELQDALDGLLSGAIELITKGASGSLTNVNRNDLIKWAQQNTNVAEALDFTRTTEGIKLTEDSFYKLYKSVKDINVLSAKKLLPTLKNMSKSYETLTGALKEYLKALEEKNHEKASAIADVIGEYLRQSPDAYNLFNGEIPLEAQKGKNIIESTANATKTVTAALKTGKLGFEDFYGIFGELESQLGSDFELNGKTIAEILDFAPGAYDYDNGAVVDLTLLGFKSAKDWEALKAALLKAAEARKAVGLALELQAETLNGASKDKSIDWDKIFTPEGFSKEALEAAIKKNDALKAALDLFVIKGSPLTESFNELPESLLSSIVARVKLGNFTVAELQDQIIEALGLDAENISLSIDEKGKINLKFEVKDEQIVPSLEVNGRALTGDALAEYLKIAAENAEKFTTTPTDKGLDVTYRINGYEIHWEYNAETETSTYTCDGISAPTEEELISLLAAFKEKTDNSKPKTTSIDGTTRTYVINGVEYEVIIDGENITVKGEDGKAVNEDVREKIEAAVKNVKTNVSTADAGADVTTKVDADTKMADEKWSALKKTIEENPVIAQVMANLNPFVSAIEDLKIEKVVPVKYESSGGESEGGAAGAMGTAFAGDRKGKTLMGELGPEMYVTNGHYYVAGLNGAEMVDLPDDAIVFNHLLTRKLLEKGYGGRGKAVTNERKAAGEAHAKGVTFAEYQAAVAQLEKAKNDIKNITVKSYTDALNLASYKHMLSMAEATIMKWKELVLASTKLLKKAADTQKEAAEQIKDASEKQEETAKNSQVNIDKILHDNYGTIRKSVSPEALAKLGLGLSTPGAATTSSINRRKSPVTSATLPLDFDISSIIKSLSGGKGNAGKTEADLIKLAKELQSVIQSVLQDVVSKGFENIDLSTYEKLPEDIKKQMQAYINNSDASYSEFVRAYIDVAGYGIKEGNALIFEAYQKQFENVGTSAEIQSALGELSFFNNGAIAGSDETWTTLFGEYTDVTELIDAGVITYNKELQQWVVTSVEALQQFHTNLDIDEFQDIINDSKDSINKNLSETLTKAISGEGLTRAAQKTLKELMKLSGYDIDLEFDKNGHLMANSIKAILNLGNTGRSYVTAVTDASKTVYDSTSAILEKIIAGEDTSESEKTLVYDEIYRALGILLDENSTMGEFLQAFQLYNKSGHDKLSASLQDQETANKKRAIEILEKYYKDEEVSAEDTRWLQLDFKLDITAESSKEEIQEKLNELQIKYGDTIKNTLADAEYSTKEATADIFDKLLSGEYVSNTDKTSLYDEIYRSLGILLNENSTIEEILNAYYLYYKERHDKLSASLQDTEELDRKRAIEIILKLYNDEEVSNEDMRWLLLDYNLNISRNSSKEELLLNIENLNKEQAQQFIAAVTDADKQNADRAFEILKKLYDDEYVSEEDLLWLKNYGINVDANTPQEEILRLIANLPESINKEVAEWLRNLVDSYYNNIRDFGNTLIDAFNNGSVISFEQFNKLSQIKGIDISKYNFKETAEGYIADDFSDVIRYYEDLMQEAPLAAKTYLLDFATKIDISKLTTSLINEYKKLVDSAAELGLITSKEYSNIFAPITDALKEATNKAVSTISNAISGSATATSIEELKNFITSLELGISKDVLDAKIKTTETPEGLKLEEESFDYLYEIINKNYPLYAKTLMDNYNELYFKEWEERLNTDVASSAKNMSFFSGGGAGGSSSDWKTILHGTVKVSELVEKGLLEYNEALDTYYTNNIAAILQLAGIEIDPNVISDGITESFKNIIDLFKTGLEGGLNNVDANLLQERLKVAGIEGLDLKFETGLLGLKLSQESAIALYNKLKEIDSILAELAFRELRTSLEESNDNYKTMTSLLNHIADLQLKVNDTDKYNDEKIRQYKEELALAKEIVAVRATSEDSSFSFLSGEIPGAMHNPLNYVNDWISVWKELRNATENKTAVDFSHMYNTLKQMNDLANLTGETVEFLGMTLDGSSEAIHDAIMKTTDTLGSDKDGSFGVLLSGYGESLTNGVDLYSNSADNAIHGMAKALVKILDALIAMFEVIVAMEEFEAADVDKNGLLDLNEIFDLTGLSEDALKTATVFKTLFIDAANKILETINSNEEFKQIAESIKLNGYSVYELILDASDGVRNITDISAEAYLQMVSVLYEPFANGNYDLNDIYNSFKEVILTNKSGFTGNVDLGNTVLNVKYNAQITKNTDGTYTTPSGQTYNDLTTAMAAALAETVKDIGEVTADAGLASGTITYESGISIEVKTTDEAITYDGYSTLNQAIDARYLEYKNNGGNLDLTAWEIELKIRIIPVLDADLNATSLLMDLEQVKNAIGLSYDEIKEQWDKAVRDGKTLEFEAKYGIQLNKETTTEEDWTRFKELAGIETKNIEVNASINLINNETGESGNLLDLLTSKESSAQVDIGANINNANAALLELLNLIKQSMSEISIDADTGLAKSEADNVRALINSYIASIDVDADVENALSELDKIIDKLDEIKDTQVDINVNTTTSDSGLTSAKGNVALAAGTRTLMGELGPELYVTNGHYFVAGLSGAEFVDLPKDAIVFNHLQTQRLLATGSTGRGRAVTSETNAVALAKGGPAAASSKQTLNTLKELRAMWSKLAEASIVDLAGAVNKESSGDKNKVGSWVADIERWYNLLQKIARLEKEINYLEALRSKIEADRVPNGVEYYLSLVDSLKNLREQAATLKLLADSYNDYFETRRKELNESPLSKFYEFNEAGQVQYKEGGLYQLASLFELDDTGKARYTPKQQYDILKSMGLGEYMLRDSNGLAIERDNENIDLFYYDSVQAAYERMTAELQEMQDLYNNKEEAKVAYLEAITKADKLLLDIIDNQMDMELKVLDAIETREQKIIDKMTKERQALADSSAKYFEGLEQALNKEREMYSRLQDQDSLAKLQRRLSILQRSGGSASEIASLQQEITDKQRDAYFEAQEAAIQEAKDASDLQLEKMQELIDLMTETLEYEKANGLLWGEVATILSGTSESIMGFITTNMPEWLEKSATALNEELRTLRNSTLQWVAYYNNSEELVQEMMGGVQESVDSLALDLAKRWNEEIQKSSPLQLNYPVLDTQVAEMQALYDNNNSNTQIDKIEYNVNVKQVADAQETERLVLKAMMEGEYPWKNAFKLSPVNNSMSKGRYS